jgi:short-subunit dehydrogenase
MKISGRTALVTGANRGLGAVFVDELVTRDCKVYACGRNLKDLDKLAKRYGERVLALSLDVTSQKDIAAASAIANDVNFLVNNAGRLDQMSLGEAGDLSSLRAEMDVNVYGLAEMCLAFAPIIGRNGGGAIVNMLSAASLVAIPHFGSYAATKAAAMSLTHSMRWDFERLGVDVIGIYASLIDTGMVSNVNAPKTSPEDVVRRAFIGIEAGELDIAVDERSKALRAKFHNGLEEQLAAARERANARR